MNRIHETLEMVLVHHIKNAYFELFVCGIHNASFILPRFKVAPRKQVNEIR